MSAQVTDEHERLKFNCAAGMAEADPNGQFVDYYAEHNILRREGFVTRLGNLHCAFKPGTRPLLCRPVTEETGRLLLPNVAGQTAAPKTGTLNP